MKKGTKILLIISTLLLITILVVVLILNLQNKNTQENHYSESEDKKIFGTVSISSNWVKDPTLPENVFDMSKNPCVILINVKSIGEASFVNTSDSRPYTPINVEIKDVLKGNCSLGEKTIYMIGGDVKVSEVINRKSEAEIEKMGLDTLSDEEKESMYISYSTDYDFPLEVNRDYAVILSNSDIPTIMGNGYGIFENKNNVNGLNTLSTNSFTNVLTGKALDI